MNHSLDLDVLQIKAERRQLKHILLVLFQIHVGGVYRQKIRELVVPIFMDPAVPTRTH